MDMRWGLGAGVALMLLAGCASTGGGASKSGLAPGRFVNDTLVIVLSADGSYLGTTTDGDDWVRGSYRSRGDEITVQDSWMHQNLADKSCVGKGEGRYRWQEDGGAVRVRFTLIEDACAARARGIGNSVWQRQP